jgi:hypothetical protein
MSETTNNGNGVKIIAPFQPTVPTSLVKVFAIAWPILKYLLALMCYFGTLSLFQIVERERGEAKNLPLIPCRTLN